MSISIMGLVLGSGGTASQGWGSEGLPLPYGWFLSPIPRGHGAERCMGGAADMKEVFDFNSHESAGFFLVY